MKLYGGRRKSKSAARDFRQRVGVTAFAFGLVLMVLASRELWLGFRDDAAAQTEYTQLREMSSDIIDTIMSQQLQASMYGRTRQATASAAGERGQAGSASADGATAPGSVAATGRAPAAGVARATRLEYSADNAALPSPGQIMVMLGALYEMNPDFVGWLAIPGTAISYPVVRGTDNSLYLRTTFSGAANPAGAIFMDYGCAKGFDAPVCMVYGHNMRDKSMFGSLSDFLDRGFVEENPNIAIITADGRNLVYRIFEARRTDVWDSVYTLDSNDDKAAAGFPAAASSERLLVLSTCVSGSDRDARLLVLAALEDG